MNRVQPLRFSATGVRPTVATRQPGELYVNFADNALGLINAAQSPVDLIAIRFWSSLANYAVGSYVINSGAMYVCIAPVTAGAFNPAQWTPVGGGGGGGGIPEAPINGHVFGRQNAGWADLSVGIMTGALTVAASSGDSTITINKFASGHDAQLVGQTAGQVRWDVTLGDSSAETGGNVGSDFSINAFADNGTTLLSTPIYISRKTGLVQIATGFAVAAPSGDSTITINKFASGHDAQLAGQTAGKVRWDVTLGDSTPETGANAGSDFSINGFADNGTTLVHTPLFISRKTGLILLSGDPTSPLGVATKQYVDAHGGPGGGIPEAPNDGQLYGRKSLAWAVVSGGGGGIADAPNDGTAYARKSLGWSHLTHGDITDWTTTLAGYLALSGGTMTGPIASGTVAADPTAALGIASKQYVDAHSGGSGPNPNLVDNGDMSIAQRGTGVVAVPSGSKCAVDRWFGYATASRYSMGQNYNGLALPAGFHYFLGAQCTSATAAGSSDYFALQQALEGDALNGFNWGAAGAQPVALSFWACASLAGTYSGAFNNGANNRSYVFTFALPTGTPTKVTILVPGDTAGTWVNNGPNAQLFLIFDLGSGTGNRTSVVNAWTAGDFAGQTGAAGIIGNNGAKFSVTGVKLELAAAATPFAYDSLAVRLARCQRYFQILTTITCDGYGGQGFGSGTSYCFPMRAPPTVTLSNQDYNNANSLSVLGAGTNSIVIGANFTGSGHSYADAIASLSAEI